MAGATTPYITYATIKARVSAELYVQAFDRDGDGTVTDDEAGVDLDYINLCIADAQSIVDTELYDAFPDALNKDDAPVDVRIQSMMVGLALWCAVKYSPLATDDSKSPFRTFYKDAMELIKRVRAGLEVRPVAGDPPPTSRRRQHNVQNTTNADGTTTLPYTRVADGRDPSDF